MVSEPFPKEGKVVTILTAFLQCVLHDFSSSCSFFLLDFLRKIEFSAFNSYFVLASLFSDSIGFLVWTLNPRFLRDFHAFSVIVHLRFCSYSSSSLWLQELFLHIFNKTSMLHSLFIGAKDLILWWLLPSSMAPIVLLGVVPCNVHWERNAI